MTDQKNTILAIVLSALVFIVWQYFFGLPIQEKQKQVVQQQQQTQQAQPPATPSETRPQAPGQVPATLPTTEVSREAALAKSARVPINTSRTVHGSVEGLKGSIALTGGRIDDLSLLKYRETVDPGSPAIVLLSPSDSPSPFYAEFGWVAAAGTNVKVPGSDTVWQQQGAGELGIGRPVTLTWDNGEGLAFRRTISVDDKYLFTVHDDVVNRAATGVTLYPYALISRHGTPPTLGNAGVMRGTV